VKLAHVILVLLAKWITKLRLPTNAGFLSDVERYRSAYLGNVKLVASIIVAKCHGDTYSAEKEGPTMLPCLPDRSPT
jgi:hypothetical protein